MDFDRVTGSPRLMQARAGFLSGTNAAAREEHGATKRFLREHRGLFGHGPEAIERARVVRDFTGAHNGLRTVVWAQEVDGVEVFDAVFMSHTTKRGELAALSSHFVPDANGAAGRGVGNRGTALARQKISVRAAAAIAAGNVGDEMSESDVALVATPAPNDAARRHTLRGRGFAGDAEARLVWLPMNRDALRLCWDVVAMSRSRSEMYRVLVDADSGDVLLRRCLTEYLTDASYRVFTSDSPSPLSPGNANSTITNQPPVIARTLVTFSALDTNASPAGWISDGGNETLGNNVDAHTDRNANNVLDEARPTGSPSRVFDFAMNLANAPTNYSAASVVQLFYWNNFIHDKLYALGFTEAAGNFQSNNFARGGLGGDAVQADAQDGSGVNNANMSTPPDGSAPRMQMYVFNFPNPDRDGDFDADIVIHEYVHGLSNRRVGGGVGLSDLQSRGMGEGWSDFYALSLLSEAGDNVNGNYAMGGYATFQLNLASYQNNYYFGIRRYPYSTDLTKNPLTFKDIDPAQASAHAGVPLSPLNSPFNAAGAAGVHAQGEVWCATLWEARANFVNAHGGTNGNWMFLQLVTDGMNLSPANPNFLESRDAIILADQISNSGANSNLLWTAFAKRGMGFSAWSPDASTTSDVIEAYDLPNDLRVSPAIGFVARGPLGGPFTNTLSLTLTNSSIGALNWSLVNTSSWLVATPASGTLAGGATSTVFASVGPGAASLPSGVHYLQLKFTNLTSGSGPTRQFALLNGLPNYYTEGIVGDSNDLAFTTFNFTPDGGAEFYGMCRQNAVAYPTDPTGGTTLALTDDSFSQVTLSGTNTFSLFGQRTNRLFIGSNGYLTLNSGDIEYVPTFANHFNRPRVSGLFKDLLPSASGTVSWRELTNRVAVTWNALAEYGTPSLTNSFQIELFFDGRLRMTFLRMSSVIAIAGLSPGGGTPPFFEGTDLSAHALCSSPPVVSFMATTTNGLLPLTVNFLNFTTGATNHAWNFGDGNVSSVVNPANTYTNAGSYSVTLVSGGPGGTSSLTLSNYIAVTNVPPPPPPVIVNFAADLTNGLAPLTVNFTNFTTGATNYTWDFGDGNISSDANPANTYTNAGSYSVTLVADGPGGTNSLTLTNLVVATNAPPSPVIVDFAADVTNGLAPLTVNFTNLTTGATNYAWDFGDGNISADVNPANTYTNAGSYSVTLVADGPGGTNSLTLTNLVVVTNAPPPPVIVDFAADVTNGLAPLTVNFTNLTTGATNYAWDFGDGNISADVNPANTYSNAGSYSVTLVADGPGGTNSLTQTNLVVVTNLPPPLPVADFVASVTNGYVPLTVSFTNLSTAATNFAWDFGDGNSSTDTDAANTYSNAGSYTVTLVADGPGGTNMLTRTNHLLVANPPELLSPLLDGDGFKFAFETLPGWWYSVQFKDALDETNWTPLPPPLLGDGFIQQFTNTPPGATRFYRLTTP